MYTFGPIPSRRLKRSLGINNLNNQTCRNLAAKTCSFSCVYCQAGRTGKLDVERTSFVDTEVILEEVEKRLTSLQKQGETVDYLSVVPEGEPTIDIHLGRLLKGLKAYDIPVAVITNSSLLWMDDVVEELCVADWVSVKVDSTRSPVWHAINRPRRSLDLDVILGGILRFASMFKGTLVSETMVIRDLNDRMEDFVELAEFLGSLEPSTAYINLPTRPPAESTVHPPEDSFIHDSWHILRSRVNRVEYLQGSEGNAFSSTGDLRDDLLSITAVHPMNRDAVEDLVRKTGSTWAQVEELVSQGYLSRKEYEGDEFFVRRV